MKKNLFHIVVWVVALSIVSVMAVRSGFLSAGTAQAVGDLTIDWGVPMGGPIFSVVEMMPGQTEIRNVTVTNNAGFARLVGVRNVQVVNTGLGDAIDVVMAVDGVVVYGEGSATGSRTLTQLFIDSGGLEGTTLKDLGVGESTMITFGVSFNGVSSNWFQEREVVFDITLGVTGVSVGVPEECAGIEFDGDPIIGTDGSDRLRGTIGNDLIFGLEGSDSIRGLGGDDCLVGGTGSDSLRGGDGDDVLLGNEDSDGLRGGDGDDVLYGGEGTDGLRGGRGNDELYGGGGGDSMRGGWGDDTLIGDEGGDTARGERGIDKCDAEVERGCEG